MNEDQRTVNASLNKAGYTASPVGQGPYLRSLEGAASSSEAKDLKNPKKLSVTDGRTEKAGCRVA